LITTWECVYDLAIEGNGVHGSECNGIVYSKVPVEGIACYVGIDDIPWLNGYGS
jgi:hypothetical protein